MRDRASELKVVGVSRPSLEAERKVRGEPLYLADMDMPGMAHAKVLRSPFPHARIVSIDASAARALPGVVCVLTRDEVLADSTIDPYYGYVYRDVPIVAIDKVRHEGDIVAVVVAEDEETAEDALELIDVEYDELASVMDIDAAMAKGAIQVHEVFKPIAPELRPVEGTNICHHSTLAKGDIEQGFREADHIFEDSYSAPAVQHCALELHGCIASVGDDEITVWTNCQSPFPLRGELQRMFNKPARVIVPYVGGGFGSKSRDRLEAVVVAAAKLAGRPVRLLLTQEETFQTFIRPALTCTVRTGVKSDGTIVARHHRFAVDVGAYSISGARSANNTLKVATGPYRIPHVLVECDAVYTNKPPSAPYRGLPTTQHTMAYETQLDRIANELGLDPIELRMKNLLVEGDVHVTGDLLRSVHAKDCLEKVSSSLGPQLKGEAVASNGTIRGRGFSCSIKYTITPSEPTLATEAEGELQEDGLFEIRIGTVNMGQGVDTMAAAIGAEAVGVPIESVRILHSDTALVPQDHGTTASRATFHTGNAVLDAGTKLRAELLSTASDLLEEDEVRLELSAAGVAVAGSSGRSVSFVDIARHRGGSLLAKGECWVGGVYTDESGKEYPIASTFWTFGSVGAEVEVSRETGEIRVLRIAAAANVGKAVNPEQTKAQLEGGVTFDLGPSLFERLVWGDGGQLMTTTLMDYPLPTLHTMPEFHVDLLEFPYDQGPYGANGVGEMGGVMVPAAIINAVYDATGVLFHEVPLTPETVLAGLEATGA